MANIDIQKKRGGPWGWIIGLLALVLLIWAGMEMLDDDDDDAVLANEAMEFETLPPEQPVPLTSDAGVGPAEVAQFQQQCASATGAIALDHSFIQNCVLQMTSALQAVVQRDSVSGTALAPRLEELRTQAGTLTSDPQSLQHGNTLRDVFTNAASLVSSLAEQRPGSTLDTQGLQQAAGRIAADTAILDQREAVHDFFIRMGSALESMSRS